jgi:hypothetical protein
MLDPRAPPGPPGDIYSIGPTQDCVKRSHRSDGRRPGGSGVVYPFDRLLYRLHRISGRRSGLGPLGRRRQWSSRRRSGLALDPVTAALAAFPTTGSGRSASHQGRPAHLDCRWVGRQVVLLDRRPGRPTGRPCPWARGHGGSVDCPPGRSRGALVVAARLKSRSRPPDDPVVDRGEHAPSFRVSRRATASRPSPAQGRPGDDRPRASVTGSSGAGLDRAFDPREKADGPDSAGCRRSTTS